jgi:hypothetical protein
MSEYLGSGAGGFEDLVPWADPYIASLMAKLRRSMQDDEDTQLEEETTQLEAELPPPLESTEPNWPSDWSRRRRRG